MLFYELKNSACIEPVGGIVHIMAGFKQNPYQWNNSHPQSTTH